MIEESFLRLYLKYTSKQESPDDFHLWVGMTVVAAALGRKCFINRGYYKLFPNLFTILVAGSARCRKSTAINIGVELLKAVPTTRVIGGKITPERFIEEIKPDEGSDVAPSVLVHSGELSVFLTKQQYGEPLIHILTDMYDCPREWTYKTKNKGQVLLKDLFLCIIAATTPDGVAQGIPPSALLEGFASRVLFIYQPDTPRRNALPELTTEDEELRQQLWVLMEKIGTLQGEFTLTADARKWYIDWYNNMQPPADKRLEGMFGRKHDHVLRVAMVLAASHLTKEIDEGFLDGALRAVEAVESNAPHAFAEIGGDQQTNYLSRAALFIKRSKRVGHSEVLRKLYPCRADQLKIIMETLIESGLVKRAEDHPNQYVWVGD